MHLGNAIGIQEAIKNPNQEKQPSNGNVATLISTRYGTRLSGHPNGYVDLSPNNDVWEQWQWEWISPNKFFWKNIAHGKYLRA